METFAATKDYWRIGITAAMILVGAGDARGADTSASVDPHLALREAKLSDVLAMRLASCWLPPSPYGHHPVPVTIRVELNRDGTLAKPPLVVEKELLAHDPEFRKAATNALDALRTCLPLKLPAEEYELWKEVELRFDPFLSVPLDLSPPEVHESVLNGPRP
ncbi:hypothetical protein [Iodidimonas sp. SYSU 1G8]|uniref:hypothetical protein n=1 Tax=Iodidimonas sp. SYSU 1G8 TaxID=3133967 RepID=UPI0031FEBE04